MWQNIVAACVLVGLTGCQIRNAAIEPKVTTSRTIESLQNIVFQRELRLKVLTEDLEFLLERLETEERMRMKRKMEDARRRVYPIDAEIEDLEKKVEILDHLLKARRAERDAYLSSY